MAIINDTDLLVVQNGGSNYTYSGAQLKDDMREFGSGGTAPTPSLAEVCAVGSTTTTAITCNDVNCDIVRGNGISISGDISATSRIECNGLGVNQKVECNSIGTNGGFEVQTNGRLICPAAMGLGGTQKRAAYLRTDASGLLVTDSSRSATTYINDVDTTNFIAALKKIRLSAYNDTAIAVNTEVLHADSATNFLAEDAEYAYEHLIPAYLIGVCQKQQELIESLTTRIEQLEADHASAMNNMEDDNGSSTY